MENQNIEYKKTRRDEYLKWICAFANTEGGRLYIGIDDNGNVCGVDDPHKLSEDIPNKIRNTMGLICTVNLLNKNGMDYFEIITEKYPFPVSYHGKYYRRTGSTMQEVSGLELDKMILSVQGRTWDSVPVPHISVDDLENDAIKLFKKKALDSGRLDEVALNVSNKTLIQNLHITEGKYLTRACMLVFHPDPEKWVTGAYPIQIRIYKDKIRLWNDGALPKEVPVEDLYKEHVSKPCNPNLANVFFKCGMIESWARGFSKITRYCEEENAKLPVIDLSLGGVTARCFASDKYLALMNEHQETENVPLSPKMSDKISDKMSDKMSDKDKSRLSIVLDYLQSSKNISSSKAAELLNVEIKTANRLLVKAVELEILDASGINKTRTYSMKLQGAVE